MTATARLPAADPIQTPKNTPPKKMQKVFYMPYTSLGPPPLSTPPWQSTRTHSSEASECERGDGGGGGAPGRRGGGWGLGGASFGSLPPPKSIR